MNKVFLAGRLASDPQPFVTSNGLTQSRISIACSDNWNKKETYFFPCIAWQSTANYINQYLKKGDPVIVDGKLIRRSYVSKEGKTVYVMEIVIETIRSFGSSKKDASDYSAAYSNNYNKSNINNNPVHSSNPLADEISEAEFEDFLKTAETTSEFDVYNVDNQKSSQDSSQEEDTFVDLDWMKDLN